MQQERDEHYMALAMKKAEEAAAADEVPVGALIVKEDKIIAAASNRTRRENNPLLHAEICAIETATRALANERLTGCTLYVTKEPCSMCAGAIVHARIERVVIGTRDYRYGACGTVLSVCGNALLNHVPDIVFGVLEEKNVRILKKFFKKKRK